MPATPEKFVRVEEVMGIPISVHVLHRNPPADLNDAVTACFDDLREIDRVFSTYTPDSDISRINRSELSIEDADARVAQVAAATAAFEAESGGRFSARWQGGFDPTGYVKGWAVENAARAHLEPLMTEPGIVAAGINAGGDMQLFSAEHDDWVWRVGIADPRNPPSLIATLPVRNGAVATSGIAERGEHIIDPATGEPASAVASATVVASSLARADVWATTAVVAGMDDLSWMPASGTASGILVGRDGRIRRWVDGVEVSVVTPEAPLPG